MTSQNKPSALYDLRNNNTVAVKANWKTDVSELFFGNICEQLMSSEDCR